MSAHAHDLEEMLSPQDLAELTGTTRFVICAAARRGEIPSVRIGRFIRFRPSAVRAWIDAQEQASTHTAPVNGIVPVPADLRRAR